MKCKSILSDSGLYGVDFSINPYTGCEHGCEYCFASYMRKYTDHSERWGDFVDVKTNARSVLEDDLMARKRGSILLSSVTDPYQPLEEDHEITRSILERLADTSFPVTVLTKSDLVVRDLDVLQEFSSDRLSVGFTINFLEEEHRKVWEPDAPPIRDRIEALTRLSEEDIYTYVHVGPHFPGISDLSRIMDELNPYISELQVENLTMRENEERIMELVRQSYPALEAIYEEIAWDPNAHAVRLRSEIDEIDSRPDTEVSLFLD
ncbi:MAG: radical SAM protein [Candidatus Hadarchaeota archaeon]